MRRHLGIRRLRLSRDGELDGRTGRLGLGLGSCQFSGSKDFSQIVALHVRGLRSDLDYLQRRALHWP